MRPPMLLIMGSEDTTVLPRNTEAMAARLREFGSPVTTRIYEGKGHVGIVLSMLWPFRNRNALPEDMSRFIQENQGLEPIGGDGPIR